MSGPNVAAGKFVIDENAPVCQVCRATKFGILKRRHLCRQCGKTMCSNCGTAKASSLFSTFSKKDRETNLCIVCQRSPVTSPGVGGAGIQRGRPSGDAAGAGAAAAARDGNLLSSKGSVHTPILESGSTPSASTGIASGAGAKQLPASQRSQHSEVGRAGILSDRSSTPVSAPAPAAAAAAAADTGAVTNSDRSQQAASVSVAAAASVNTPATSFARTVDWTSATCVLCHRSYAGNRRRASCDVCQRTVCTECRIQRSLGGSYEKQSVCTQCSTAPPPQPQKQPPTTYAAPGDVPSPSLPTTAASPLRVDGNSAAMPIGFAASRSFVASGSSFALPKGSVSTMLPVVAPTSVRNPAMGTMLSTSITSAAQQGMTLGGTSFRPTSMLRRSMAPTKSAAAAAAAASQVPLGADVMVQVGSVRKLLGTAAGSALSASLKPTLGIVSEAMKGNTAAFVLGTTPMGSLPAQFFLAKQQAAAATAVDAQGCGWHRFLHEVTRTPNAIAANLDRTVWIADVCGRIARDHLRASVDVLIERHTMLRTSFVNGRLHVYPSATVDFRYLSAHSLGTFHNAEAAFIADINKPFELESCRSLLRVRMLDHYQRQKTSTEDTTSPQQTKSVTYTLAFVFHKSIASHGAITLFFNDLKTVYQHAHQIIQRNGEAVVVNHDVVNRLLPRQPAAYDTYCLEEREYLQSPVALSSKQYWLEQLQKRTALELPTDFPRTAEHSPRSKLQTVTINAATAEAVNSYAKRVSVPVPLCYLSAFVIVLQRYTSQESVTVALLQQVVNDMYVDTLGPMLNYTIHSLSSEEKSCAAVTRSVAQSVYEAEQHVRYPFLNMILDVLNGPRGTGGSVSNSSSKFPLADVAFSHEGSDTGSFLYGADGAATTFAGMELRSASRYRDKVHRGSVFDLTMHFWDHKGRPQCVVEFNDSLFSPSSMHRFAENFVTVLRHFGEGNGEAHTNLTVPLVSPHQIQDLLYAHNENFLGATAAMLDQSLGLLSLVRDVFTNHPDDLALVMPEEKDPAGGAAGKRLTFRQLDEASNIVAHMLRTQYGAAANAVVAVAMQRCVSQMVCVLGILKSGAAYLPLDISYPADRLEFMLQDSQVVAVLTHSSLCAPHGSLKELFARCDAPVLPIADNFDAVCGGFVHQSAAAPEITVEPEDASYIIYTSGSTGKPKGVVMNHRALTNLVLWQNDYLVHHSAAGDSTEGTATDSTEGDATSRRNTQGQNNKDPQLRVLQFSPISFDVSFQELFTTWSNAGVLFMVSESLRLDPQRLIAFLNTHSIHRIFLPFVALNHICETALETGIFPNTLEDIITAGEQLVVSRPLVECMERLLKSPPQGNSDRSRRVVLHNHYGPSETHVCSYYVLQGDSKTWPLLPPIGRPISNTQLYVVDDKRQLVPYGVVGELFIAGDCLGTGYLNRPDATDAAFVPCTFPSGTSARMYKTGDLVQQLPDGNLMYVRRKDTQVKVRGFRIELGEIEAKLSQHRDVKKCCVVVRDDDGEKKIVAYLVAASLASSPSTSREPASTPSDGSSKAKLIAEFKGYLKATMPEYMVPSVFVFMDSLPLTPSGKVNRKGLPRPSEEDINAGNEHGSGGAAGDAQQQAVPPRSATEVALAKIWAEVLRRPMASLFRSTNFFDAGGHSLSITKVASRVVTNLSVDLPLSVYFANPVLCEQARMIDEEKGQHPNADGSNNGAMVPFSPVDPLGGVVSGGSSSAVIGETDLPMTYNQQSLVFLCFSRPESAAVYNISLQGRLVGDVSATELSDIFENILKLHPSLRTTYHQDEDGRFTQRIHDDQDLDVNIVQLDEHDESSATDEDIQELLRVESVRPFNLSTDSLMRVRVYLVPNSGMILQLVFHHVAVDLWSLDLILDDVIAALGGARGLEHQGGSGSGAGAAAAFTASKRPSTYAEYAKRQILQEESGNLSRSAVAWKALLNVTPGRELSILDIPTDYPRPLEQSFHGGIHVFSLSDRVEAKLRSLVKSKGTTLYTTLLSLLFVLLHKYSRQEEVFIGTPMACRNVQRFESTVGYFINAIPIRMTFPGGEQTLTDVLLKCKEFMMTALEHQDYPFPLIADQIVGARSSARTPVFQALFTFQAAPLHDALVPFVMYQPGSMSLGPRATWENIPVPTGHAMYDLVFQFADLPAATGSSAAPAASSTPTKVCGTIEYNADIFSNETIKGMVDVFEWLAEQCCDNMEAPITALTTAPESQRSLLLNDFNVGPLDTLDEKMTIRMGPQHTLSLTDGREANFVSVFQTVAKLHPDKVALSFGYAETVPGGTGIREVSFATLDAWSNQIARALRRHEGLRGSPLVADDIVGVSIRRSIEMIVVMLAVMKAGAAYVPVDPAYPKDRVTYMVEDAQCRLIVVRTADEEAVSHTPTPVVRLEELLEAAKAEPTTPLDDEVTVHMNHLAYVIYTSGSTGKPKGTLLEHRGLVNLTYAIQHAYRMKYGESKFLLFASSSFDASALEIFCPLGIASAVVMLGETTLVGEQLARAMSSTGVTIAVLPPSVLSVMTDDYFPSKGLEVLVTAGEAINDELLARWRPKVRMLNGYGPTENTVCSTVCDYDADNIVLITSHAAFVEYRTRLLQSTRATEKDVIVKSPPIGRSIPNYRSYVVDDRLNLVAKGIPGELLVSSPGVARGYHRLPQRTSQSFLPNPFHPDLFPRLYRTGDLVRWVGHGQLEFLGRIDQQVKLRGYRIELGEIESVVLKFDASLIVDCAVDIRELSSGKALVAYLVLKPGGTTPSVADLKRFLRQSLPDYMVPSAFVTLRELPLSPSGKVDRKSLPAPYQGESKDSDMIAKASPQTPTQAVLLVLASEVLGSTSLAISDDFFESGGHSLAAMQLASRIRDHLGVEISIAKLFEMSKLSALADYIESIRSAGEVPVELSQRYLDEPGDALTTSGAATSVAEAASFKYPLSYNQEALWFAYASDTSATTFNVSLAAKIEQGTDGRGQLDLRAWEKALYALVLLHPMLRSVYDGTDANPMQRVRRTFDVSLSGHEGPCADGDASDAAYDAQVGALIENLCHTPFNLESGDVFRVVYICGLRSGSSERAPTHLILLLHHIVADLGSVETLIRQLSALYLNAITPNKFLYSKSVADLRVVSGDLKRAIAADAFAPLGVPLAAVSYLDFVYYQRELVSSVRGEKLFNYWQRQLTGYPPFTTLPTDFPRPARPSLRGGTAIMPISPSVVQQVVACAKKLSTTPLTVYLACLYSWLFRVTGQNDVVVGMPVSSRTRGELEHVLGDFVNLCPLRLHLDTASTDGEAPASSSTFRYITKLTKSCLIGALSHQEYPFQLLVQQLQQYRDPSRAPMFQVLMVHEKPHHTMQELSPFILGDAGGSMSLSEGKLQLSSVPMRERTCPYDLVFALSEGDGNRMDFRLQYATDLFEPSTAQRFAEQYLALLECAVKDVDCSISRLSMLTREEEAALRHRNEASEMDVGIRSPDRCTVGQFFEASVAQHADERALFDTVGNSFTYRQLNEKANILAHHIRRIAERTRDSSFASTPVAEGAASSPPPSAVRYNDHPTCIFLPRGVAYVIAVVGCVKANTPYTPIDVKVPEARVQYILEASGCRVILTDREHLSAVSATVAKSDALRGRAVDVVLLENILKLEAGADTDTSGPDLAAAATTDAALSNPTNTVDQNSCLYTIFTSGSTGLPKGVMVHHGGVINVCQWFVREHRVEVGDVSAQALGAAFDPVTIELFPYFFAGAAVVIMDDDSKFGGPEPTVRFLHENRVTHITFPTVLSQMIFESIAEFPQGFAMRSWTCGGDKFKGTARPLPFSLINAYGPTECCVLCTQYPINFPVVSRAEHTGVPRPAESNRLCVEPPLGEPTANTAIYILDSYGNQVPRGVVGELCVGGAQVGIGYRQREDATAKVFTPDLFGIHRAAALPPPRLYHTGDLVRMDHEYRIHFVGRRDFQVKIRGFRIELGEIETQLLHACAMVTHAVCVAYQPDAASDKQLAAFVALSDEAFAHVADGAGHSSGDTAKTVALKLRQEIKTRLKGKLPDYMVPHRLVMLRSLPLTPNGKVDRAVLPEYIPKDLCGVDGRLSEGDALLSSANPNGSTPSSSTFVAPKTADETKLCSIWEELLQTKPIGLTDNWYDKGGSSLTSTMLLSRMRQVFQMELSLQQFFVDPTVTGLLRLAREKGNSDVAAGLTAVLEKDAQTLDPSIAHRGDLIPYDVNLPMTNVFVTGVTGFLGAFILQHILQNLPLVNVYCLVRAKTEAEASSRIFKNLDSYHLLDGGTNVESWMDRVIPVVGDLALDYFGLSASRFMELCTTVDCIIHNGALVNFSYPYVSLKAANVGGTVTALKLATTVRMKPLHFISTLSTVPTPDSAGSRVVTERLLGSASDALHGGYTQTKWVAERLVILAASRGVPCTVVRPGRITGHKDTGACNLDDFLNLFIKGCVEMAAVPILSMPCEMTPVDFCAQAIVEIALRHFTLYPRYQRPPNKDSSHFIYHLTNTSSIPWNDLMNIVVRQGNYRNVLVVPYEEWRKDHLLKLNNTSHCALIPLVPMFGENFEEEVRPLDVRTDHLDSLLAHAGLACPVTNESLVMTYVRYFIEKGFLPKVAGTGKASPL